MKRVYENFILRGGPRDGLAFGQWKPDNYFGVFDSYKNGYGKTKETIVKTDWVTKEPIVYDVWVFITGINVIKTQNHSIY